MEEEHTTIPCMNCGVELDVQIPNQRDGYDDQNPQPVRYELMRMAVLAIGAAGQIAGALSQDLVGLISQRGRLAARREQPEAHIHNEEPEVEPQIFRGPLSSDG